MFNLSIRTNATPISRITKLTETVANALAAEGISTQGAVITLNGRPVMDLDVTFNALGISEGSTAILSVVVKTSSAM